MKKIFILILLSLLVTMPVNALETPKTIGLGSFATLAGVDGIYLNPATVNIDKNKFKFQTNISGGFNNNLFRNEYITENKKDKLLNGIESSGWVFNVKAKEGISLTIGPVGFFSNMREEGNLKFNPDVAEILLAGNQTEAVYSLDNSFGDGALYNDSGINFSYKIPERVIESADIEINFTNIHVGMNLRFLTGAIANLEANGGAEIGYDENGNPTLVGDGEFILKHTDFENMSGIGDLATGSAFDIGLYGNYNEKISGGASILNLGSLKSDTGVYKKYVFDSTSEDIFRLADEGTAKDIEYKLPTKINIGCQYDWKDYLTFLVNFSNINYSHFNDINISLGAEYDQLKFLPLRLGMEYSTLQKDLKIRTGLGLHLGAWKTDIGVSDVKGLFNKSQGLEFGISSGFSF